MDQFDDSLLVDAGLSGLSEPDKASLLHHLWEELSLRVGAKLSEGLTTSQLDEFSAIVDRDYERIVCWLELHAADFINDPVYERLARESAGKEHAEIVCQYVATKWLEINAPDYRTTVADVLAELKAELQMVAGRLLGN
ncbi:DUF5663 domain-containing protein [Mycobacterium sp. M26]|uniref:DUF5663 domain-containing protein n=1 Tax=Mycobacterium sp. M26 TaxID=1762962 RepID=UPI00073F7F96|nr:DUF5663 domain-containing protein [Mycobacterium sp. M26]